MDPWMRYGLALGLTIGIETLLACLLRRDQCRRLLIDVPLMNLFTHPLLHFLVRAGLSIPLGEAMVMAIETIIYRRVTGLSWAWSLAFGIGLNGITWSLGALLPA